MTHSDSLLSSLPNLSNQDLVLILDSLRHPGHFVLQHFSKLYKESTLFICLSQPASHYITISKKMVNLFSLECSQLCKNRALIKLNLWIFLVTFLKFPIFKMCFVNGSYLESLSNLALY